MGNVPFTRDEAILALDVLFSQGIKSLGIESDSIKELSDLLNRLPIIHESKRGEIFRNCSGIWHQLYAFQQSFAKDIKDKNVGIIFYVIADEFKDEREYLHLIAEAIRRNEAYFSAIQFGDEYEEPGFKEGVLLGHLHRYIEKRDGRRIGFKDRCEICKLDLSTVYQPIEGSYLEHHLLVSPTEIDVSRKYNEADFITVCPNCHAVLHKYRPWINKDSIYRILR